MVEDKKRIYKKNFLTNVIFRADFPKILELGDKKSPAEFQKKIRDKFPIINEIKGGFKDKISWEFLNKEKTKRVLIDSEFIIIECFKYEHFEDFFKDIKFILDIFFELYPVKISKRIELRYINQIKLDTGNAFDWDNLIDENLFSVPVNFVKDKDSILKSMQLLEIKESENLLKFQFGFFNSEYPNPITRKEFVLDYDCINSEEIETSKIFTKIKEFNIIIKKWFEKSIKSNLRKIMEEE